MLSSAETAFRRWLVEYLAEHIAAGAITRENAVDYIRAAADRVVGSGTQTAAQAKAIADAMIAGLPND